jgi:hypothetical protein
MTNENNHVFIVGLPRTGTSIMYRTIQRLPNFRLEKLNLHETAIFRDQNIAFDSTGPYYPGLSGYFFKERDMYESFLESVKEYTNKLKRGRSFNRYALKITSCDNFLSRSLPYLWLLLTKLIWQHSNKKKIIIEYFNHAQKSRQSKRLVEKTPHHYLHAHQIVWTFPNSRILWMIRHPVDIITSSIKRAKIDKKYKNYWNAGNFCKEFRKSFYCYDFYKRRYKDNMLMIKYEDFVNDPVTKLKNICTFLQEPYSGDSLLLDKNETFKWKPDPHLSSGIVNKTEKNWQDHLSLKDAGKIETSLQDLMGQYGFDFYSRK